MKSPVLAQRAVSEEQEGEQPDHPSCSQNAHDTTMLVRCTQKKDSLVALPLLLRVPPIALILREAGFRSPAWFFE
jgi:hypothetical protein